MKKFTTVQIVWNNVQFYPEKEGIWYRGESKGKIRDSHIRYGDKILAVSHFTYYENLDKLLEDDDYDEPVKDGWSATVYQNYDSVAHRGLSTNDHIQAKNVDEAEDIAMEWANIET